MRQRKASVELFDVLRAEGVLSEAAYARAVALTVESPGPQAWRRSIDWLLLGLGTGLVLTGVVLAVAFNWAAIPSFVKMGTVGVLIAGAAAGAVRFELSTTAGKMSLLSASVLVGPLLALYGQHYQTGADPFQLFFGWSALIALWVAVANFAPLWLIELAILQVGLGLWFDEVVQSSDFEGPAFALVNGLAWAAVELSRRRGLEWLAANWVARSLGLFTLGLLTREALDVLFDSSQDTWQWFEFALCLGLLGLAVTLFQRVRRDLFLVASALFGLLSITTAAIGQFLANTHGDAVLLVLLMGVVVLAEASVGAYWLRRMHLRWVANP